MLKYILFISCYLIGFLSAAQKQWTLEECIEHALKNNISIKQSEIELELADIQKSDAIGNFLPSLNASAMNAWNTGLTQNVTTGILQTQTTRNSSYSITAGVNLFNGLRNIRMHQRAVLSKLAAQYNVDKMKDDIALMVANSYLQILLNKANLEVIESQNRLTQEHFQRSSDLVDAGMLPRGDLLEIQATDANEKQRIAVAENEVRISLINLAQLLLIKDYENFDIADREIEILPNEIIEKPVREIISIAMENRPEIKIAENRVKLAEKDLELERSNYYPSLAGFFNYNTRESGADRILQGGINPDEPAMPIGIVEETGQVVVAPNFAFITEPPLPFVEQLWRNDGVSYGVQLNVPIFNGMSVRNNVKRRKLEVQNLEYQLEQAQLDLESTVYQAFIDVKGALKAYEAAEVALQSQELAFQYANERYDVGLINAFDFSQAKLRLDNAKIEVNRSKFDYVFKLKVLELYFGISPDQLKL